MISAYSDGSGKNSQRIGAASFIIVKNNIIIYQHTNILHDATNNVAEYTGLLSALDYCIKEAYQDVTLCTDSELVVKQLNKEYQIANSKLKELALQFHDMVQASGIRTTLLWVPRTNIYIQQVDRMNRVAIAREIK